MPAPSPTTAPQSAIDALRARIAGAKQSQGNPAAPDQIEALKARIAAAKGQRAPSPEPRLGAQLTPRQLYSGMASVLPSQGVKPGVVSGVHRPEPEAPAPSPFQQRRPTLTPGVEPQATANLGRASLGATPQQRTPLPPLGTERVGMTPEGRPMIRNPDGSFSTERTITVTDPRINGGRPTNIPSMFQGREVPQELAIRIIERSGGKDPETGRTLPGYDSIEEAVRAAQERSHGLGAMPQDRPQARLTPGMLNRGMASVLPGQREGADEAWREQFAKIAGRSPESVGVTERWQANGWLFDNNLDTLPAPPPPLTPALAGGLVQGIVGGFAGIPESAGIQHQAAQRSLAEQYSRIDRGERPYLANIDSPAALARITDYLNGNTETRQRLRAELDIRPVQEEPAFAAGQALRSAAAEAAPIDPRLAESFPVQLAQGIGSTGAFVATGLAGRLARIPGGIAVAGTGALVNGAEGFRSAVQQGASFEDAVKASRLNAIAGVSEALPIARLFDRLDAATGGQFRRALTNAVKGGGEEAAQEVFQTVFNNLVESKLVGYDPTQGTFTGTPEAGGVGFTVGALFNFAASMLGLRPRRNAREFTEHLIERQPQERPAPRPATRGPAFERGESVGPTEPRPVAPDLQAVIAKAREDFSSQRAKTHRVDERIAAIRQNMGEEAARAYEREYDRLVADALAQRQSQGAAPAAGFQLPPDIPRKTYRGFGRGERGEVYGGAAVPILGEGRYSAFTREGAERFGPDVEEGELTLSNPLVIRSDEDWRALTREAGWRLPNPFGQSEAETKRQTEALQQILRERGHDGVIVHWDDSVATDYDEQGRGIKLLRNVFGQPQAFELEGAQPSPDEQRRAAEKAVNERQAAEQAARQTILVQPDFIPQATITQVPKQGDRFFRGGGMVANGHVMLLEGAAPPRLVTAFERHVSQNRGTEELKPDSSERLMKQAKKHDGETFKPLVVRDPSLRDESGPPIVYAKSGGKWIALNAVYYDYLTQNGFEIRWKPSATKNEGFPLLILKDGKPVGGIMRVRVDEKDIPDLEAALTRFQAAEASPTPIDPNAPKLGRDVLSPPRSAAQVEARARAEAERRFRDKTPPETRSQARSLQAETIKKLDQLEREAVERERVFLKAKTQAAKRAEAQADERPGSIQGEGYRRGFLDAWQGESQAENAGALPESREAYQRGYKDGASYAKSNPPPPDPQKTLVEFVLPSATGKGARFKVYGTSETIRGIKSRASGTQASTKFHQEQPGRAGGGLPSRNVGGVQIFFPDESHAALIDLASNPSRANAQKLFKRFVGYVEGVRNPSDVIALARDYAAEVRDVALGSKRSRGGQSDHARFVVDPDRQTRYLQRERLGMTEDELPETAFSVQGARGGGAGPNYVGFVRDQMAGTTPAEPIRREDILQDIVTDLQTALYQGRMKGRKLLGFFRPSVGEVRIKRANDIETAIHELAHLLDNRFPEIRAQWLPATKANQAIRDELSGVSYDARKLYEGFAEFVRLWATQKDKAQAAAPRFYGWFEDFVARNQHGPAIRRAQERMHEYFAQDALSRAKSKIGLGKEINGALASFWDRLRQSTLDDLHGILRAERELSDGPQPGGAYETARLTRAKFSIIEGALLYGAPTVQKDGSHKFVGKGLRDVLLPVSDDLDNALLYFVGRAANELLQQGREHLFTPAEVKAMLALETPARRQAFEDYQDWNNAILNFAERKGLLDPVARAFWKRAEYLPFHRVGQGKPGQAVAGDWRGIKALTGGTENLRDILGNIVGNASMLIDAALTNEARLEVAKLAKKHEGARFMAEIPTEEKTVHVHRAEIERVIREALGIGDFRALPVELQIFMRQITDNLESMIPLVMRGQAPLGGNVVAVLVGGKPRYFEVADPTLLRSLLSLNRPLGNIVIRLLALPKRIGQISITLSPDFLAANLARDTAMGAIMSRHGFKPVVDSLRGMKSRLVSDQNYRDFIANGGGLSSYLLEESALKANLRQFYRRKKINPMTVLDTPGKLFRGIERIADAVEMSTRLGEYQRAIRAGEHPRHAAYLAREVSTDFAMRPTPLPAKTGLRDSWDHIAAAVGFMYDTVIFLKAAMNGMDRLYRGVRHDPNRLEIAAKVGLLAVLSGSLALLNRDNPLYDDLEDWDKDVHWHFYVPTTETMKAMAEGRKLPPLNERFIHLRYPKLWEIGAVGSMSERALLRILDEEAESLPGDAWRILQQTMGMEYLPQIFVPPFEVFANYNRFLERPIESQADEDLMPWARGGPGTSRTLRELGEATRDLPRSLQFSPPQVEALIRGYFNTWGMYGLMLSDAMFYDDLPSLRADQYPVLRRFYSGTPPRHTHHATEFYDALREATEVRRTMKLMDRTGRRDIGEELENRPENLRYRQLTHVQERARSISAEMRKVVRIPDLPALQAYANESARDRTLSAEIGRLRLSKAWSNLGDLKRDLLDMWTAQRNDLFRRTMTDVRENAAE